MIRNADSYDQHDGYKNKAYGRKAENLQCTVWKQPVQQWIMLYAL